MQVNQISICLQNSGKKNFEDLFYIDIGLINKSTYFEANSNDWAHPVCDFMQIPPIVYGENGIFPSNFLKANNSLF